MLPGDPCLRPILACRVENNGASRVHMRVYCPRVGASVSVEACEVCAAHIALPEGEGGGQVRCGPEGEEACERVAEAPPIGALVKAPVRAVEEGAALSSAAAVVQDAGAEPVLVVDVKGVCVGTLSRLEVLRRARRAVLPGEQSLSARDAMAEARVVLESASVHEVLRMMAVHRLRYLAIVAEDGTPLGLVSDVEALQLHIALRR